MDRRHILSLSAGVALAAYAPTCALAQERQVKRVGHLTFLPRERWPEEWKAGWLRVGEELRKRGWVEGQNLQVEYRDGATDPQGLYGAARRLVESKVDLIEAILDDSAFAAKYACRSSSWPLCLRNTGLRCS